MSASGTPPAWQAALQWPDLAPRASADSAALPLLKAALVIALLALTVLDRFGLRLGATYAAHPALPALYGLLALMLVTGTAELNRRAALRYVALVTVGAISYLVNVDFALGEYVSIESWLLLIVLYAPLVVSLREGPAAASLWRWVADAYMAFALLVAFAGIAQFAAQFAFRPAWLFNYTLLIPEPIRGFEVWKTVHPVGQWFKSNGFFLREPSFFSLQMGFALLCELSLRRRHWVMATLGLGLVLSYSGSGLLVLGAGLLFPLGRRVLLRLAGAALLVAAVFYVLGNVLNLSYIADRIDEFGSNRSSAYCRFVDPVAVTLQSLDADVWTPLLGHGPGTLHKMYDTCETAFAKVPFEYGLLGALAAGTLLFGVLRRSRVPVRIRAGLAAQWATQPFLLGAEWVLLAYLLCAMWPEGHAPAPPKRE